MRQQWHDLPSDLLYEIDKELTYIEKVRVRATCVWWNSALPKMPNHKLPQFPWLLQTNVDNEGNKSHALFNLCERKSYKVDLPQLQGKLFIGSSNGWLVTISVDQQNETAPTKPDICLLNPLTGTEIKLPPRSTFPDVINYYPDRVSKEYCLFSPNCTGGVANLNSNHVNFNLTHKIVTSKKFVAVAIFGESYQLAWCMPGHEKWTPLDLHLESSITRGHIEDAIFSNDILYILNNPGHLIQVENVGQNQKVTVIVTQRFPKDIYHGDCIVIVECSDGRLMLVAMYWDEEIYSDAYEVDEEKKCWKLVDNIGNDMLFLGHNDTFSISASQFPGYRGNCAYLTDDPTRFRYADGKKGDAILGIYNFEDEEMEKLPGFENVPRSVWPQAVWVQPNCSL